MAASTGTLALSSADRRQLASIAHVVETLRFSPVLRHRLGHRGRNFGHRSLDAPGFLFVQFKMALGPLSYLGFSPRTDGFNPVLITQNQAFWYWFIVVLRFLRLVIVVPLVEEIFWRGFLMRFLCDIDGDYWKVPFGKFHWLSLVVVTAMFVMAHAPVDYVAAAVFGILMYGVAVKTKSLTACIVMHATANFILGLYVLSTQQWGYW